MNSKVYLEVIVQGYQSAIKMEITQTSNEFTFQKISLKEMLAAGKTNKHLHFLKVKIVLMINYVCREELKRLRYRGGLQFKLKEKF